MVNMSPAEAYNKCSNENRRIPELESIIATSATYSYWYSRNVIKGRFEEGEKSVATNSEYSYWYARNVIKGPFHLCHPIIFNFERKKDYIDFLKSYDLIEWLI